MFLILTPVNISASGILGVINDTLFKFFLPDPEAYYGENDTTGFPEGMVALPGSGEYYSTIDSNKILRSEKSFGLIINFFSFRIIF